jgi:hypothetical protein
MPLTMPVSLLLARMGVSLYIEWGLGNYQKKCGISMGSSQDKHGTDQQSSTLGNIGAVRKMIMPPAS